MSSTYTIRQTTRTIFDSPKNIDFHINTGDYFSFLATLMGFMEEALAGCETELAIQQKKLARELRHDLRYVQANYRILPRSGADIQVVPPKGNLIGR